VTAMAHHPRVAAEHPSRTSPGAGLRKRGRLPRAIFEAALRDRGAVADDAVFVGDSWEADVESPRRIGMHAIYVGRPPAAVQARRRGAGQPGRVWRAADAGYRIRYSRGMGEDEWEIYQTDEVAAWMRDLRRTDPQAAEKVEAAVDVLAEYGPTLGRPLVDTLVGSKLANLKELRPPADEHPGAVRLRPVAVGHLAGRGRQDGPVAYMV
jgi:Phage derived protein Gp49-like (DUF891)/HAD-hyrolase-like